MGIPTFRLSDSPLRGVAPPEEGTALHGRPRGLSRRLGAPPGALSDRTRTISCHTLATGASPLQGGLEAPCIEVSRLTAWPLCSSFLLCAISSGQSRIWSRNAEV